MEVGGGAGEYAVVVGVMEPTGKGWHKMLVSCELAFNPVMPIVS